MVEGSIPPSFIEDGPTGGGAKPEAYRSFYRVSCKCSFVNDI